MILPELEPWRWVLAAVCAVLVGMAKTGVPGLGVFVVPMMFHAVGGSVSGQGALLPLLCAADVFGVAYYRRHAHAWSLLHLFPWVGVGIALGTVVLHVASDGLMRMLVGALVLAMVAVHVWRKHATPPGSETLVTTTAKHWQRALVFGVLTGFATTVANAAGPVMNLYLLSMDLPKDQFMGTGAWFFLLVNLVKLPIYVWQGLITWPSLWFDALLLPGIFLGALLGKRIYQRLPQLRFEQVVLTLTVLAGLSLLIPR